MEINTAFNSNTDKAEVIASAIAAVTESYGNDYDAAQLLTQVDACFWSDRSDEEPDEDYSEWAVNFGAPSHLMLRGGTTDGWDFV